MPVSRWRRPAAPTGGDLDPARGGGCAFHAAGDHELHHQLRPPPAEGAGCCPSGCSPTPVSMAAATASCAGNDQVQGLARNRPAGPGAPGASGLARPRRAWTRKRRRRAWRPGPWPSAGAARRRPAGRSGTRGPGKRAPGGEQEKSWLQLSAGRAADRLWQIARAGTVRRAQISGGSPVLWPFPLAGTSPSWVILLLGAADLVIRVARPGHHPRQPAPHHRHGLAAGHLLRPVRGPGPVPAVRQLQALQPPLAAAGDRQRQGACRHLGAGRRRKSTTRARNG